MFHMACHFMAKFRIPGLAGLDGIKLHIQNPDVKTRKFEDQQGNPTIKSLISFLPSGLIMYHSHGAPGTYADLHCYNVSKLKEYMQNNQIYIRFEQEQVAIPLPLIVDKGFTNSIEHRTRIYGKK